MTSMAALALLAFCANPISAYDAEKTSADKTSASATCASKTEAKLASEKAGCTGMAKEANATSASAKTAVCTAEQMAACAAAGCSMTECDSKLATATAKEVNFEGKLAVVNMNISGMTCNGCSGAVSAELMKLPGVVKVAAIDYKSGFAKVVVDPAKVKNEMLATTVTSKGYKAEFITAVATSTTTTGAAKTGAACCSATDKAACAAKEAAKVEATEASAKSPQ